MDADTIDLTMGYTDSDTALPSLSDRETWTLENDQDVAPVSPSYKTGRQRHSCSKNQGPSPKKARYVSVHKSAEPTDDPAEYDLAFFSSLLGNPINSIADLLEVKTKSESPYPYWGQNLESTNTPKGLNKRSHEETDSSGDESISIITATTTPTPLTGTSPTKNPASGSAKSNLGRQKTNRRNGRTNSKDNETILYTTPTSSPLIPRPQPRPTRRNVMVTNSPKTSIKTGQQPQPILSSKGKKKSDINTYTTAPNTPITGLLTGLSGRSKRISEEDVEELRVMAERSKKAAEEFSSFAKRILEFLEQF